MRSGAAPSQRRHRARAQLRTRLRDVIYNSRISARLDGRHRIIVLGDSHSEVLSLSGWRPGRCWFDVTTVGGATASGIRNPNSVTEALPRFRARLRRARPWQTVMVMLGEVDCGYIIFRRAMTSDVTLDESFEETVRRYVDFLDAEVAGQSRLMVMSAPLPTLPDDSSGWGEVARRRADVEVSQANRTAMTVRFNARMAEVCRDRGWEFVDSSSGQLDAATGLIADRFIQHGAGDHHLSPVPYRELIAAALSTATEDSAAAGTV